MAFVTSQKQLHARTCLLGIFFQMRVFTANMFQKGLTRYAPSRAYSLSPPLTCSKINALLYQLDYTGLRQSLSPTTVDRLGCFGSVVGFNVGSRVRSEVGPRVLGHKIDCFVSSVLSVKWLKHIDARHHQHYQGSNIF